MRRSVKWEHYDEDRNEPIFYDTSGKDQYERYDPKGRYFPYRWCLEPTSAKRRGELEMVERERPQDYWRELGRFGNTGCFAEMIGRKHYWELKYDVWFSELRLIDCVTREPIGYALLHYQGNRKKAVRFLDRYRIDEWNDRDANLQARLCEFSKSQVERLRLRAHLRILETFGRKRVEALNAAAQKKLGRNGGGDPDLFVFRENGSEKPFFVELKLQNASHHDRLNDRQRHCFDLIERYLGVEVHVRPVRPRSRYAGDEGISVKQNS